MSNLGVQLVVKACEIAAAILALILALAWIVFPDNAIEPWLALITGLVVLLELYRRYGPHEIPASQTAAGKLLDRIHDVPLSQSLSDALRWAKNLENKDFERWCRLELYGYTAEGGKTETDEVPSYRFVAGRWFDNWGVPLDTVAHDISFVNEVALVWGAKILEEVAAKGKSTSISHDGYAELIRKNRGFNAVRFKFSSAAVAGLIDSIKNRLAEGLAANDDGS